MNDRGLCRSILNEGSKSESARKDSFKVAFLEGKKTEWKYQQISRRGRGEEGAWRDWYGERVTGCGGGDEDGGVVLVKGRLGGKGGGS